AAFELLQSHDTVSSELITQAEQQGGSATCTAVLRQQLAQTQPVSNLVQTASAESAEISDNADLVAVPATTPKSAAEDSAGIVLKGRRQKKL
ncbi:MAG: hypothetical protein ACKPHU_25855, partial [Planctomycetaceae bacterium]